jgi:hypothetical protein
MMMNIRTSRSPAQCRPGAHLTRKQAVSRRTAVALALSGALAISLLGAAPLSASGAVGPVFVVDSRDDGPDAKQNGVCATAQGACTLRAALREANAAAEHATITFALTGSPPFTISPATKFPGLTNPAGITIDGYSQPGAAPGSDELGTRATIAVEVRGQGPSAFDALVISTPGNVIRGLALYNFPKSIYMIGEGASGNRVVGNFVCTNAAGTFSAPSVHTRGLGILLSKGAHDNVIGAPGAENRNVVSGCPHRGITMSFNGTSFNTVQNNVVGLNPAGTAALPNRSHGVDINYTRSNVVGGDGPGEGNIISGNAGAGIEVSHSRGTQQNMVVGNFFGTDLSGETAPDYARNGQWGVRLEGPKFCDPCTEEGVAEGLPSLNTVRGNVIVNNGKGGMLIDKGMHDNVISDNKIGLTANGTAAGNRFFGIRIERGAYGNVIGPNNEIAYNPKGVTVTSTGYAPPGNSQPTYANHITRNSIYNNSGLGIDLAPFGKVNTGGVGDPNVHKFIQIPILTGGTPSSVSGTTSYGDTTPCGGCRIEVYIADITKVGRGEGKEFIGEGVTALDGSFTATLDGDPRPGATVTAVVTDAENNSSEFSKTRKLPRS